MSKENSSLIPKPVNSYGSTRAPRSFVGNHVHFDTNETIASTSTDTQYEQIDQQSPPPTPPPSVSQSESPTTGVSPHDQMNSSTLSLWNKIGFGLGHVYNDLCAGVWFSYTLLFLQGALGLPGIEAGSLMMLGQVGDALATPVVGYLADRFGTKQKWHIFGTVLVFFSFPLIFSICPMCDTMPTWWHLTYFAIVILTFQIGWPIVQVTHLAIIPEMSRTQKDRAELTSIRYSAQIISSVIVFIITWAVLHANRLSTDTRITLRDAYRFRDISLILTIMGLTMTVCFHFSLLCSGYGLRRRQALDHQRRASVTSNSSYRKLIESEYGEEQENHVVPRQRKNFFKTAPFYQNAILYVFARLFTTTALVYIPLWLDERSFQTSNNIPSNLNQYRASDLEKSVEHIATVPLVSFLSSFLSSLAMKYSHRLFGHKVAYLLGSVISVGGCVFVAMSYSANLTSIRLYGIAVLFGTGSSITMVSSLCLIADMIGRHADQSGFVYSAVTFADKLITGVAIVIIESFKCDDRSKCPDYYKKVLAYGCGGAAVLGLLTLLTLKLSTLRPRRTRTI